MKNLLSVAVWAMSIAWVVAAQADEPKLGNIAPQAKTSASSTHPQYPLAGVNDSRMETPWSTAPGKTSGEWLRFDWETPQNICGVILRATGPWTQTIDVQVDRDGKWVSAGKSGSAEEKTAVNAVIAFKPERTKSVRFVLEGGAAYYDVEVYTDSAIMAKTAAEFTKVTIMAAGDLRGHLMGTASQQEGSVAVRDADVTIAGATPNGPWKETAKTGKLGEFEVPLPFALSGPIEVSLGKGDLTAKATFDSRDISVQLTPKSAEIKQDRISLCGTWDFAVDPPKDFPNNQAGMKWSPIKVPAHWEMEGFVAESGRAAYRKSFTAPSQWKGKRVKLLAEAIYSHGQVWVNGRRAGGHEGGFTPFELDITDMVKPDAENEILVLIDARSMASEIDNGSFFAYFELAGIWQPIEVFATSPTYLSHLSVTTDFDQAYQDAQLTVELDAVNQQTAENELSIRWRLLDPQGQEVLLPDPTTRISLGPWQRKTLQYGTAVKAPQSWNAEQPRLYKLIAEITDSQGQKNVIEQPFGFREIEVKHRTLTLNGKAVKFRGISRVDAHPLLGRALTPEVDRQDMELIKAANFNMVRATIAPPHPASLDASDELGLYVENEGPTCWGNHAGDLRYAAIYQGVMCEFLERDRNHPSVVDWSMCNESSYDRVFSMTCRKMRSIDSTRTYTGTWGDDTLDMVVYHHPMTPQRIKDSLRDSKPAFFDEVMALFHGLYDHAFFEDVDPGMRDYWLEGLPEMLRTINAGENQAGTVQFCWVDDAFLVPGKGICVWRKYQPPYHYTESVYKLPHRGLVGDCAWGTLDGWRRPRPEYWLSKKMYSPVQIENKPLPLPQSGQPIVVPVENFNQFTDLSRYLCRWEIAREKGETRPAAAPMSKGELRIASRHQTQPDDQLVLRFYDERGKMVDAHRLCFIPHEIPTFPNSGKPARIVEEEKYLSGASDVRLLGPNVELSYDRTSGELSWGLINRELVLTRGPKLHILKTKAPNLDYPVGSAKKIGLVYGPEDVPGDSVWQFTGADCRTEGNQAVLNWKGKYGKDLDGGFEIRMDDAGDVEFGYEFKYLGNDILAREIGLDFELPLSFDKLSWDRKADYNYYPDDHISRPVGEAIAHPAVPQTVPAGERPYGLDDHALGCNEFRSAKRLIYTAGLTNKTGEGLRVISDGTQHVRATVGTHQIHLKVLDYYGGVAVSGDYHYGFGRTIKTGEVLKGTVRLKLLGDTAAKAAAQN